MKSEFVAWQETISAKKYDLHDEKQHDQPEGTFTQRNMNRSQQSWVKTFLQDVMDEQGRKSRYDQIQSSKASGMCIYYTGYT